MMKLAHWEQHKTELRRDFLHVLGAFPERKTVTFAVLPASYPWSDTQWTWVKSLGAEATADYVCPEENPDNPDYRRRHIRYPSAVDCPPVHAFLRIPKNRSGKLPAVLCLHGHVPGCFFGKESMDITAIELTKRGFVTLAVDMLPFGERRDQQWDAFEWEHGHGSMHFWGERNWFMNLLLHGQTLLGLHVWELQRALDILQALPEVDATRIGATGHSGGGINTFWLSALDDRITCGAASAGVQSYSKLAKLRIPTAVWSFAPILTVGDAPEILSLIAPRPFMGIESANDKFGFDGAYNRQHVYPVARAIYELYGAGDRLAQHVYAGDHDYHASQRTVARDWLVRWLKP